MKLEKDKKYSFQITGKKLLNGSLYYTIMVDNKECSVKAFESQRGSKVSQITCVFKGNNEKNEPVFAQDFAMFISNNYKVGEVYEFKVKTDNTQLGYYEVVDANNILMRLVDYGDNKVYVNQMIKARVKSINVIRVELELITSSKREGVQFLPLDKVVDLYDLGELPKKYIKVLFEKSMILKDARDAYDDGNSLWVIQAADTIDKNLAEWLTAKHPEHKLRTLKAYHRICTNLLEQTEYLLFCTKEERIEYQKRISTAIIHAEDYIVALDLMTREDDKHYIDDHLNRLEQTRYLLKPEHNMRVIMSLFSLRQTTVQNYIKKIFAIVRNGHNDEQFMNIFKNAFIEMLDVFIWNESRQVNLIPQIHNKESKQRVEEMVEALALQLLLLDKTEDEDKSLYRSMLYRYASVVFENSSAVLLEKSYLSLFIQEECPLEYTWEDLKNVEALCVKLSSLTDSPVGIEPMLFHGNNVAIKLLPHEIVVTPMQFNMQMRRAYPDGLTPWRNICFMLNARMQNKVYASTTNLNQLRLMWSEVERHLFDDQSTNSAQGPRRKQKHTPSFGDTVTIRISGQNPVRKHEFNCVIVDDDYVGEGIIKRDEIVHYNVAATANEFVDEETKQPFLLKAMVKSVGANGKITFTMLKNIEQHIYDFAKSGKDVLAQVTWVRPDGVLCITEFGYAMKIMKSEVPEDISAGDIIWAQVVSADEKGNVNATFKSLAAEDEDFDLLDAFYTLMRSYSGGNLYQEKDEETANEDLTQPEIFVERDYIEEVIHIIDRYAMTLGTNKEGTFNYLSIAKILSRAIQDDAAVAYYAKRKTLVKELTEFSDVNKISDETLTTLLIDNKDFVSVYPEIKEKLTQMQIINHLDKKWSDDFLWELAKDQDSLKCSELAKLVLIHNMMDGLNVFEQQQVIRRKIFQTMDLNIKLSETLFVAHEDQFTELKASMIYPAGKDLNADENAQMTELLTVVCSMLNARGGTLYVGVNNSGYAIGLDNDFTYMNGRSSRYDITQMKDKFDLKFRNCAHDRLGTMANQLLDSSFITVDDKVVYKVEIQPSSQIVTLDGKVYVRQGTSKWRLKDNVLDTFKREREQMFKAQ